MTSALSVRGSTRRWRRLRTLVLLRDGERCQVPVEPDGPACLAPATLGGPTAGHVDHVVERRHADVHGMVTTLSGARVHVDAPSNLRAACRAHNLGRPRDGSDVRAPSPGPNGRRWSW